ncbi:MAG: N-acetyltransferase [Terracidiphilus sp.]
MHTRAGEAITLQWGVLYRLYKPEDFTALYEIEEICFQPPFRFGRGYMRQLVSSADAATWIAEEDGQMAGFAIVEWELETDGTIAYIQTLEVDPEQRGAGVGAELLRRVEGSARMAGADRIWLHVDAENGGAIRLYERHGYRINGREENYYAHGRAALVYSKALEMQPDS